MTTEPKPDPDGLLFDDVYAWARGRDPRSVPWVHGAPHPLVASWLATAANPSPDGSRALVIGSGLGDDAEALAGRGWQVTAFDASPHAIDWSRQRFPGSRVDYRVANLFDLPAGWRHRFDLVVEVHTVQALPVTRRQAAIGAIAGTLAPGGTLVVVTMTRNIDVPLRGRPWPLTLSELATFERYGLVETGRETAATPTPDAPGRVRCTFTRPR